MLHTGFGPTPRSRGPHVLERLGRLLPALEVKTTGKWFLLSGLVGVVTGLGAILFQLLCQIVVHFTLVSLAGFQPGEAAGESPLFEAHDVVFRPWALVLVMALGGLVSGVIVYAFAPEAAGPGTDAAIDAFHNRRGVVRARVPFVKTIASAITLGTGGSAGREGPIAQIGAGFGSMVAGALGLSDRDRRILLAAGMGAGVGAIFRSPLAGALFSAEILYREEELESDVIVPAAFSAIVGYAVFGSFGPGGSDYHFVPLFGETLGRYRFETATELFPLTVLALVLVFVGMLYIRVLSWTREAFDRIPVVPHVKPMIGATLAALVGLAGYYAMGAHPHVLSVLSTGYGTLQDALVGDFDEVGEGTWTVVGVLFTVAFGKILTTSLTTGSGGSGGVFGPSMVIGGCLGAAVGLLFRSEHPGFYAVVGMTGFFGGCAHAPISTIIMVSELTGEYKLLVPAMWVSALCFLLSRRFTLYSRQVPTRLESPAHRGDFIVDVLEGIRVEEVYRKDVDVTFVPERMTLDQIVHVVAETQQHYYPVIDDQNRFVGIFSSDDVRSYLFDETIWQLAVARDVMVTDVVSVTPDDDLNTALRRFTAINLDELPVLDPNDPSRFLGMIRRKETIAAYNRALLEHKQVSEASVTGSSTTST